MVNNKYDQILERFKQYYLYLYEDTVDWWPSGRYCITVKTSNGSMIEFDSFDNSIRTIKPYRAIEDVECLRRDIGYNLQKVVRSRGIPQSDIAKQCGITEAMLSRYIHGTSLPSIDKVKTLAVILGCRVIDIIGEDYD